MSDSDAQSIQDAVNSVFPSSTDYIGGKNIAVREDQIAAVTFKEVTTAIGYVHLTDGSSIPIESEEDAEAFRAFIDARQDGLNPLAE